MTPSHLRRPGRNTLAYFLSSPAGGHDLPCVMFLGGFRSDMSGSKALAIEAHCRARGQGFVRFDYSGHGISEGRFEEGCIGQWFEDARDILDQVVPPGDVLLVGSSMGGWISLLLFLERPERIKGLVGIAAAPDFTISIERALSEAQRQEVEHQGFVEAPSAYGPPYIITKKLIEDGRARCVLNRTHSVNIPITLLHGRLDQDVPWQTAEHITRQFQGPKTRIVYIEDGEHRLSRPEDIDRICAEVAAMSDCVK